ncbi:MAG: aspartate 1-decarboxylase [Armatimonadetes bacterium]|nr:aspartate 1-decarboxylase [Armatimonadota bacterium]
MRLLNLLKSKIHGVTVTEANVDYVGSIGIDADLAERAGLRAGELVHVWDVDNGQRFETYVIIAPHGSGQVSVNGAAARRVEAGHKAIIAAFVLTDEPEEPRIVLVDAANRFDRMLSARSEDPAP